MTYCFDLDGTICYTANKQYANAIPYINVINRINTLYKENTIVIFTGRGCTSGRDYTDLTKQQLCDWGVRYHTLICNNKPHFDIFVDDKAINAKEWRRKNNITIVGFVASCFDLLHAGHCLYLKEAKQCCDYLIAALQIAPMGRPEKNIPVQSIEERLIQLESVKYIDEIRTYTTEKDLEEMLATIKPDIRILGSDAKNKPITGEQYCKQIFYHNRSHGWSTSELRKRVFNATD